MEANSVMDMIKQKLKLKIYKRRQENGLGEVNIEKAPTKTVKVIRAMFFKTTLN